MNRWSHQVPRMFKAACVAVWLAPLAAQTATLRFAPPVDYAVPGRPQGVLGCDVNRIGRMQITDNGRGFSPDQTGANGHGLRSMQERAARLQGVLEIRSAPGQQTTLTLTFPLP